MISGELCPAATWECTFDGEFGVFEPPVPRQHHWQCIS
jgi:hypothetical protein